MARDENMIAALKRERAVYVARGDENRVQQVDEQLKFHGYTAQESAADDGPTGRTGADSQQQTANAPASPAKKTAAKQAVVPAKSQE